MAAGGGSVTASQAAAAAVRVVEEGEEGEGGGAGGAGAQLDEFGRDVGLQKRYVLVFAFLTEPVFWR